MSEDAIVRMSKTFLIDSSAIWHILTLLQMLTEPKLPDSCLPYSFFMVNTSYEINFR
jgi:hypothetical protein